MKYYSEKELEDILKQIVIPNSSIGVHGIKYNGKDSNIDVANKILNQGLDINMECYGLVGTICMFGKVEQCNFKEITGYVYGCDEHKNIVNVIVAIPETIPMIDGDEYFIGDFPEYKYGYGKNDDRARCNSFNYFTDDNNRFPTEFIVGYIKNKYRHISEGFEEEFILNENYIGLKTPIERLIYFDSIKNKLDELKCYKFNEEYMNLVNIFPKPTYYQICFSKYFEANGYSQEENSKVKMT